MAKQETKREEVVLSPYISIKQFLVTKSIRPEQKAGFNAFAGGVTMMRVAEWEEKFKEYCNL